MRRLPRPERVVDPRPRERVAQRGPRPREQLCLARSVGVARPQRSVLCHRAVRDLVFETGAKTNNASAPRATRELEKPQRCLRFVVVPWIVEKGAAGSE